MLSKARGKRFQLILIKPSHYDADGYVVQWLRSTMPSNSLPAVYSLALGAATRQVLGPELPIDVAAIDETDTRVRPRDIVKRIGSNGGLGLEETQADIKVAQELGVSIFAGEAEEGFEEVLQDAANGEPQAASLVP